MSRIGRMPIAIPAGVTVEIAENNKVTVKGPKGTLERVLPAEMDIKQEGSEIVVSRPNDLKKMKSLHGLTRTLIHNMIIGVTEGYEKKLEVNGVGYRAQKQLAKGIDQLMDEGVAQLFVNQFNGRKIIGTVGQLQFEVIQYRLLNEYNASCRWEPVSLYKACWVESDDPAELEAFKKRKYQYMAKDREGRDVFLADSGYVLQMAQMDFKHIKFHFTSEF